MRYKNILKGYARFILIIPIVFVQVSCKKYLDEKPSQKLATPSSLADLQAILDNQVINSSGLGDLELMSDNYYVTSASWNNADINERQMYVWDKDAFGSSAIFWSAPYTAIYELNFVLDYLPSIAITATQKNDYNNIKGAALFGRAFFLHQLAQLYCKPYSPSATTDLGIVVRLTSNINEKSVRATVQQTYDQVIDDLKTAATLLPVTSLFPTRPNKAAAYGTLARVYLSMRDYARAGAYADTCLALYSTLLDYNSLTPASDPVLPYSYINNPEILFVHQMNSLYDLLGPSHEAIIDSGLYKSYNANDLRKKAFFGSNAGNPFFEGSYMASGGGTFTLSDCITTDETWLIRAECRARAGNKDGAMADLNTLLRKRWLAGTFTDLIATDATDALNQVLVERRKELLFRGLRWSDLRRFNLEGANITLTRIVNGTIYSLPPNDLRWVLLIPPAEISNSHIPQNPR